MGARISFRNISYSRLTQMQLARLHCDFWFTCGKLADAVVQVIPDRVWHLQRPFAWLYQRCMGKSYKINERYGLNLWKATV